MAKSFAVTQATNDLYVGNDNNLVFDSGINAVSTGCLTLSQLIQGECVLDITRGIPDFDTIWGGVPNLAQWEIAFREAITSVDGVLEITEITLDRSGDVFTFTATILTEYGEGAISGTI